MIGLIFASKKITCPLIERLHFNFDSLLIKNKIKLINISTLFCYALNIISDTLKTY